MLSYYVVFSPMTLHDGCLLNWIRNFLSGRTHTTRIGNVVSEPLDLCSGSIRGSGIGPLMFIVYINELADVLSEYKVTVLIFADDLKLYAVLATDIDVTNFNSALKCIDEWANTWQLKLSVEKCCIFRLIRNTVLAFLFLLSKRCLIAYHKHC